MEIRADLDPGRSEKTVPWEQSADSLGCHFRQASHFFFRRVVTIGNVLVPNLSSRTQKAIDELNILPPPPSSRSPSMTQVFTARTSIRPKAALGTAARRRSRTNRRGSSPKNCPAWWDVSTSLGPLSRARPRTAAAAAATVRYCWGTKSLKKRRLGMPQILPFLFYAAYPVEGSRSLSQLTWGERSRRGNGNQHCLHENLTTELVRRRWLKNEWIHFKMPFKFRIKWKLL